MTATIEPTLREQELSRLARLRFAHETSTAEPRALLKEEMTLREIELDFVETSRVAVAPLLAEVPRQADGFLSWLDDVQAHGPGQNDPLFDWLETHASEAEFRWFLRQEVAGEAGFDDLVAMTQVKMPAREKLELARNYWDEMGQGHKSAMHGPMLAHLARVLRLEEIETPILREAQAVGFMMSALACNRWYAYQSLGALGAVELTAWRRAAKVNAGLKRLGYGGNDRIYYAVHATLDKKHGEAWTKEIFVPAVTRNPELARPLAEGLLLRLMAGARSYVAYRRVLWKGQEKRPSGAVHASAI